MNQTKCIEKIKTAVETVSHPGPPNLHLFQPTAVMALFILNQDPELLFIQKADSEGYPWRNQMAFPGGHVEKADQGPRETALREVKEELNIRPENVAVMGSIGHFQTINNKDIHAFTGIWNQADTIRSDPSEIARVVHIPLAYLMDLHRENGYHRRPVNVMTLTYPFEDVTIWGVTAKILHHLLEVLTVK